MPSRFPRLVSKLTPTYAAIALLAVLGTAWFSLRALGDSLRSELTSQLRQQALIAAAFVEATPQMDHNDACRGVGPRSEARLTLVAADGRVLCDSMAPADRMDNHSERPEVRAAFAEGFGMDVRFSQSTLRDQLYVAVRAEPAAGPVVVRVALSLADLERTMSRLRWRVSAAAATAILLAWLLGALVARRLTGHLRAIEQTAGAIASGNRIPRIPSPEISEFMSLTDALTAMVGQLDHQIATIDAQRRELEAVLAGMIEAVLVIDEDRRILRANPAAARLLHLTPSEACGRPLEEVVRNPSLQRFAQAVLGNDGALEDEVTLAESDRVLQAYGSPLQLLGDDGRRGALIVLHDVSQLRRLELMRRDFVANVSHELRTPITSIKGFSETLLGGALEDGDNARRFIGIIARQADRLTAIIEDLLSLARIERVEERGDLHAEATEISALIERSVQNVADRASARGMRIDVIAPDDLMWRLNGSLIEQALTNLIDNAVKYGREGGRAEVRAQTVDGRLQIDVVDDGPGIPREAQSRIFERFYRLDPSRSRDLGGTGLGLAIVKHIALAHGGDVAVDSRPGAGSRFTLTLPRR